MSRLNFSPNSHLTHAFVIFWHKCKVW